MTTVDGSTQTENFGGGGRKQRKFVSKYDIPTAISVFSRDSIFERSFCQAPEIHLPESWPLIENSSDEDDNGSVRDQSDDENLCFDDED